MQVRRKVTGDNIAGAARTIPGVHELAAGNQKR
jgi:hypothetical protein